MPRPLMGPRPVETCLVSSFLNAIASSPRVPPAILKRVSPQRLPRPEAGGKRDHTPEIL
jgi:hypothetical protein